MLSSPDSTYADVSRSLDIPVGSIGPTRARGIDRLREDPQVRAACLLRPAETNSSYQHSHSPLW